MQLVDIKADHLRAALQEEVASGRTYDEITTEVLSSLPADRQASVAAGFADFTATLKGFLEAKAAQHGEGYEVRAAAGHAPAVLSPFLAASTVVTCTLFAATCAPGVRCQPCEGVS